MVSRGRSIGLVQPRLCPEGFQREETTVRDRNLCFCLIAFFSVLACGSLVAAEKTVKLSHDKKADQVTVKVGEEVFTVYRLGKKWPKPFASPVHGPGEIVMTREIARPGVKVDHPHHKGIWIAVDEVNENKHWAENSKIENVSAKILKAEGNPAQLQLVNHWLNKEDKPILVENTTVSIFSNRLMVYDIEFKPFNEAVTFNDTKEGLFGFRMVDSMREKETGKVVNSEGLKGTGQTWGKTADWIDYYGQVEGKTLGVALMDHPANFRPSRYHVRNYGLFSISPFGEQAYGKQGAKPVTLEPGKTLRLRYGLYIHAGDTKKANVSEVYEDFVKYSKS